MPRGAEEVRNAARDMARDMARFEKDVERFQVAARRAMLDGATIEDITQAINEGVGQNPVLAQQFRQLGEAIAASHEMERNGSD